MGYKVLVTLDLPSASEQQRLNFYESLSEDKWVKILSLTTAWKVSFSDGGTRKGSISTILKDIAKAKAKSGVKVTQYAMQLDLEEVVIGNL